MAIPAWRGHGCSNAGIVIPAYGTDCAKLNIDSVVLRTAHSPTTRLRSMLRARIVRKALVANATTFSFACNQKARECLILMDV
jgi:hypothetical protein